MERDMSVSVTWNRYENLPKICMGYEYVCTCLWWIKTGSPWIDPLQAKFVALSSGVTCQSTQNKRGSADGITPTRKRWHKHQPTGSPHLTQLAVFLCQCHSAARIVPHSKSKHCRSAHGITLTRRRLWNHFTYGIVPHSECYKVCHMSIFIFLSCYSPRAFLSCYTKV